MEAVQNDQFQTDAFQRESFQCRFRMKIVSGKVSGGRVPRKGFQREGSQEGFPGGELPVIKGFQRESFQRDVQSESFQSQQPSFWIPASESVCLSVASQSRALQVAVHIFNRQCLGRVLRKSGRREGFQDRVYRGVVPRVGLQRERRFGTAK